MDLELEGRRALVTGSTSGLGHAVATRLAEEGCVVAVSGRDRDRVERTAHDLKGVGLVADLTEVGAGADLVDRAARELGGLDIAFINTGGGTPGGVASVPDDSIDKGYRSMLRPALELMRAAGKRLAATANGESAMVVSTARSTVEATPELALSGVFRSGVSAAARSLALELAPRVRVNVVIPGQFDTGGYIRFEKWLADEAGLTPLQIRQRHLADIPLGRLGFAHEFGDVVAFLCSSRAGYVNGSVIRVDGGSVRGF